MADGDDPGDVLDVMSFRRDGFVRVEGVLDGDQLERLRRWVGEVAAWLRRGRLPTPALGTTPGR